MLHILSCSPWQCDINEILRMIKINDDLLLIQNGVVGALDGSCFTETLISDARISVYALKEDVDARGITNLISAKVILVNYFNFVDLTIKHTSQICW